MCLSNASIIIIFNKEGHMCPVCTKPVATCRSQSLQIGENQKSKLFFLSQIMDFFKTVKISNLKAHNNEKSDR